MKKSSKVLSLSLAFALGLPLLGGINQDAKANTAYAASEETYSFKNTVKNFINKDTEFKASEAYLSANEAEKKIYEMAIEYGRELLENESSTSSDFKAAAEEIKKAKSEINDTSDPTRDRAKLRVNLRLTMITAKDFLFKVPRQEYNKAEYDKLYEEYGKAQLLYENVDSKDYDLIIQNTRLENAIKEFDINNNLKAKKLRLEQAYNANKIQAQAARDLIKNYPKTVAPVKEKLEALIKNAEKLQKEAEKALEIYK